MKRPGKDWEPGGGMSGGGGMRRELLRGAGTAALVLAVLVAVYYLVLAPFADPLDPRASRWEADRYTNRALDLTFTLPEGWAFLGQEEWEALDQAAGQIAGGAGEWSSGQRLMMAGDPETGVNVQLICTKAAAGAKIDGAALQAVVDAQLPLLPEGTRGQWLEPVGLGGVTYQSLRLETRFLGETVEEFVMIGSRTGSVVMIFLSGRTDRQPEQFLTCFS